MLGVKFLLSLSSVELSGSVVSDCPSEAFVHLNLLFGISDLKETMSLAVRNPNTLPLIKANRTKISTNFNAVRFFLGVCSIGLGGSEDAFPEGICGICLPQKPQNEASSFNSLLQYGHFNFHRPFLYAAGLVFEIVLIGRICPFPAISNTVQ